MAEPRRERIRQLRVAKGIRPGRFADQVGCSYNHLWGIEAGQHPASEELLNRIATALEVSLAEVMVTEDPEPTESERKANPTTHPEPNGPIPPPGRTRGPRRDDRQVA